MFKTIRNKIHEIQNSEERVKTKWLIGTSAVASVIVIVMWVAYIGTVITPTPYGTQKETSEVSFWEIMKTGGAVTAKKLYSEWASIIASFSNEKTIIITK